MADIAGRLRELLTADVEAAGFDLEDVAVTRAGARSVVRIVVDRDGGVDLDAVAVASRVISDVLDAHEDALPGTYSLEVTSPGVDRPLTEPRHWRRNIGRLVTATQVDGPDITGRIAATSETTVTIDTTVYEIADLRQGKVQIEFNRPKTAPDQYDGDGALGVDEFDDRFDDVGDLDDIDDPDDPDADEDDPDEDDEAEEDA